MGGKKLIHKGKGSSNEKVEKTDRFEFFSAGISRIESQFMKKIRYERGTK
jgi:hypothetical protein